MTLSKKDFYRLRIDYQDISLLIKPVVNLVYKTHNSFNRISSIGLH